MPDRQRLILDAVERYIASDRLYAAADELENCLEGEFAIEDDTDWDAEIKQAWDDGYSEAISNALRAVEHA